MSYMLKHTAEELDLKLDLIDENKNFLEYPYTYPNGLPMGLEDVGDGSILVVTEGSYQFDLTTCTLPAGSYTMSLTVVDALTGATKSDTVSLGCGAAENDSVCSANSSSSLVSPGIPFMFGITTGNCSKNTLIKPQIEAGSVKTDWVPNMDKIGTYVDRRFNSLNAKIKVLTNLIDNLSGGSGLPNPTNLADGTILTVKNGAWAIDTTFVDNSIVVVEDEA